LRESILHEVPFCLLEEYILAPVSPCCRELLANKQSKP